MGWANCGEDRDGRRIGYAVAARCDHPGCETEIDRGMAYACGGHHGEGDGACHKYFCDAHRRHYIAENIGGPRGGNPVCQQCYDEFVAENGSICRECHGEGEIGFRQADGRRARCEGCGGCGMYVGPRGPWIGWGERSEAMKDPRPLEEGERMTGSDDRWRRDGAANGWKLPPPAAWWWRLPVVRHVRAVVHAERMEGHYSLWPNSLRSGYDDWVLYAIRRGWC